MKIFLKMENQMIDALYQILVIQNMINNVDNIFVWSVTQNLCVAELYFSGHLLCNHRY